MSKQRWQPGPDWGQGQPWGNPAAAGSERLRLPEQAPRKAWVRRHKVLTGLGVFVLLFLLAAVLGDNTPPAQQPTGADAAAASVVTATATQAQAATPAVASTTAAPAPAPTAAVPLAPPAPATPTAVLVVPAPAAVSTPGVTTTPTSAARAGVAAVAAGQLDHRLTPGHTFASATRARVCVSGYSASARDVPASTRRDVFTVYGIAYPPPSGAYELDHLIPLELGGDNSAANLWPEPYHGAGSADVKDHLENHLHALVCAGQVALSTAQRAIAGDWASAAAKYNPVSVHRTTASTPKARPASRPARMPVPSPTGAAPAPVPTPTSPPTPAARSFGNCTEMHTVYPHGVGRSGAVDHTSGKPVTTFYRSTVLYNANSGSDRDGDGVACERK